jgi:hypothetical protein
MGVDRQRRRDLQALPGPAITAVQQLADGRSTYQSNNDARLLDRDELKSNRNQPSLRGAKRRSNPDFLTGPGLLRFARNDGVNDADLT